MRLIPPGRRKQRKGGKWYVNATWIARGTVAGKRYEIVTGKGDERSAREVAVAFENAILAGRRDPARPLIFAEVADSYLSAETRSPDTRRYIDRLKRATWLEDGRAVTLGEIPIADVWRDQLARAADALYPDALPQTRNRQVMTPGAAILHYAHELRLIDYRRVRRFRAAVPGPRPPAAGVMEKLLSAEARTLDADLWRVHLVLFCQGSRITETLRLEWDSDIDLRSRRIRYLVGKGPGRDVTEKWVAMHPLVFEMLANMPGGRTGRVFAFRDRWRYSDALAPVRDALGVSFTAHQARHFFGTALGDRMMPGREIANAGTWTSEKSTQPYVKIDLERAREALDSLPIVIKNGGKKRKRS